MDTVLTEIKKEHDEARELMTKIDDSERITWTDVEELYAMLCGHHKAEEEVFFPEVKDVDETAEELVEHLLKEHGESESGLLTMIQAGTFNRPRFEDLKDILDHHMEEEETTIFDKAQQTLSETELQGMVEPFEAVEKKGKKEAEKELAQI